MVLVYCKYISALECNKAKFLVIFRVRIRLIVINQLQAVDLLPTSTLQISQSIS